jgi:hypothetical protein
VTSLAVFLVSANAVAAEGSIAIGTQLIARAFDGTLVGIFTARQQIKF